MKKNKGVYRGLKSSTSGSCGNANFQDTREVANGVGLGNKGNLLNRLRETPMLGRICGTRSENEVRPIVE